ncbi:LysE family translocator [Pseudovibrio sp. SPO723]|nr:LysE family transporter [Pseudovibrio sp. SPO723]MDX5593100.1 LysE family transporter [Pseudovibrio sp. SPO723]
MMIGIATSAPVGPVNIMVISRSLHFGFLPGFLAGAGAVFADTLFALIAAFGVTTISNFLTLHLEMIQIVGGMLLLGFGVSVFRAHPHISRSEAGKSRLAQGFAAALAMTITNPGTIFGFLTLFGALGHLAPKAGNYVGAATLVTGVFLGAMSWWASASALIATFRQHINDAWLTWINRGAGALLFLLGVVILIRAAWLAGSLH